MVKTDYFQYFVNSAAELPSSANNLSYKERIEVICDLLGEDATLFEYHSRKVADELFDCLEGIDDGKDILSLEKSFNFRARLLFGKVARHCVQTSRKWQVYAAAATCG